ncbi:hypothetical protein [Hymenobacter radiodurans]|uniref:hypothetical protein n=1 Tax=Hymenobacter radiodurans TaxID=2496028 RepID=UPI0010587623|nr:hypothetical protein [Hymenobacter radiodurans]
MRYISLDLETTGGKPQRHQILELAAVVEDTKRPRPLTDLPVFRRAVRHPEYVGTAGALALNARLLEELSRKEPNPEICPQKSYCLNCETFYWLKASMLTSTTA